MVNDFLTQTNFESVPPGQAPQQHATIVSGTGREEPQDTGGGIAGDAAAVGPPARMRAPVARAESIGPGVASAFSVGSVVQTAVAGPRSAKRLCSAKSPAALAGPLSLAPRSRAD
jgi:hypothetical protein